MNRFISNIRTYLEEYHIKQSFLALKSGLDTKKVSRLLTGKQEITLEEMDAMAKALGKDVSFFLSERMELTSPFAVSTTASVLYTGLPTEEQKEIVERLVEFTNTINYVNSTYRAYFKNERYQSDE